MSYCDYTTHKNIAYPVSYIVSNISTLKTTLRYAKGNYAAIKYNLDGID